MLVESTRHVLEQRMFTGFVFSLHYTQILTVLTPCQLAAFDREPSQFYLTDSGNAWSCVVYLVGIPYFFQGRFLICLDAIGRRNPPRIQCGLFIVAACCCGVCWSMSSNMKAEYACVKHGGVGGWLLWVSRCLVCRVGDPTFVG